MRIGRFVGAGVITVTSLAGVLVFSPIATAVTHSSFESIPAPDPVDPGESELVVPEIPQFVPHEVRTPEVVSARVASQDGAVAAVEGLPVTVRVLSSEPVKDDSPPVDSGPADPERATTTTATNGPDGGAEPTTSDTTVAGENEPSTSATTTSTLNRPGIGDCSKP